MSTKSNRSAGTQITNKGVVQGEVLVDPVTGLPISVTTDNNGTKRLAVDANLTADNVTVDTRELDASTDNVALKDTNTGAKLRINNDGSIDANIVLSANEDSITVYGPGTVVSTFNTVTSVASAVNTTIITYTVPVSKVANLQRLDVSGTNIAQYDVLINNVLQARKRTYFGAPLNETFEFSAETDLGLKLNSGDIVKINVIHQRPDLGDFEGRIQVIEIG